MGAFFTRTVRLLVGGSMLAASAAVGRVPAAPASAFVNGRWWTGSGYRSGSYFAKDGVLTRRRPSGDIRTIDLKGGYVVPPLAEAHNHWLEPTRLDEYIQCHLSDGIFYVRDLANVPVVADRIRKQTNRPTSVDWTTAMLGFTGPGGHPVEIIDQFVAFGILPKHWRPDYDRLAVYVVTNRAEVNARLNDALAHQPAVVKALLLFSERYDESLRDPATRGNSRGMDPKLLKPLVREARARGAKVAAHVYSAKDFRVAVDAGVDEIAHLPGTGFRKGLPVAQFQLSRADAVAAKSKGVKVITTVNWLSDLQQEDPELGRIAREFIVVPNLRLLKAAGVQMLVGTDGFRRTVRAELETLAALAIFDETELLKMAWATGRHIFPGRRIGALGEGWDASFLVRDAPPTAGLHNLRNIRLRVKQGNVLVPPEAYARRESPECLHGRP